MKTHILFGTFICGCLAFGELYGADVLSAERSEWISVKEAPVLTGVPKDGRAAPGTSWFAREFVNADDVVSARWVVAGLGVFDVYVNGVRIGDDFLKPGNAVIQKTKYAFSYDVTKQLNVKKGARNILAAEVSSGWWRDRQASPDFTSFIGKKSAFRGELELVFANGQRTVIGTRVADWKSGIAGGVTSAGIYDGENYDARVRQPVDGVGLTGTTEVNTEFNGRILPTAGAEVTLRRDRAMTRGPYKLKKGETLVIDFGQNCSAVPEFQFKAPRGTVLTALPAEMLNDADKGVRGCDGPKGSVYRANLRTGDTCMRINYTFAGTGIETYLPRFTFFGYRYLSLTATDDVEIARVSSIPVTSITREMEIGSLEVGDKALNRFIQNVYWGMLSNFLSLPTDCPQRDERYGWTADAQVFSETASWMADVRTFYHKYMHDVRDCFNYDSFPVAPPFHHGTYPYFNFGWADAGVIIPWTVWRQFNDTKIVADNWDVMMRYVRAIDAKKNNFEDRTDGMCIFADWVSLERFCSSANPYGNWEKWKNHPDAKNFRLFLAACYWLYDTRLLSEMGQALGGKEADVAWLRESEKRALAYIRSRFLEKDGLVLKPMRDMQTPNIFALRHGIVEGPARVETVKLLKSAIQAGGDSLRSGFLGTSFVMDTLACAGEYRLAYDLLFRHENPSWLYSVDQGATTIWEHWDGWTKEDGFRYSPGMNSFNHYAFGAVLAWIYRHAAGISPAEPGFQKIRLAPHPDRRFGSLRASYQSPAGLIKSSWRYEGDTWIWDFTIPEGTTALVTAPGKPTTTYPSGTHRIIAR